MFKYRIYILGLLLFFNCQSQKQTQTLQTSGYEDAINEKFICDLAYETTDFVQQYWRVVGNTGFNKSIYKVEEELKKAGFVNENEASAKDILTYRIEKRELIRPTWEVVDAKVVIIGEEEPLLQHATNSNMIALNSYSTPKEGVKAEVVQIKNIKEINKTNVKGKIVFAESSLYRLYKPTIIDGGAVGLITYSNPDYLQPEKNTTSIQFRSIALDTINKPWAIAMSFAAKERLKDRLSKGKVTLKVNVHTKIYPSEELTIVADVKGSIYPKERMVFSAHVQEPGANDNASGVGVALEMAALTAALVKKQKINLKRTLTFLWGDEIISTRRYVEEDSTRAKQIKWGISLDMVGENTDITGGSFLIEKMPDPSAVWTRGNDKHTEWGGDVMTLEQMKPHYLNDFLMHTFKAQGKRTNWEVNVNPFEGGSDHVPFLKADIPGALFWHFTDQFYHTDNDRIDKVSKKTLKNVGTASLIAAYTLLNADSDTAKSIMNTVETAAIERLNEELKQGNIAIENGEDLKTQIEIIEAWEDWYVKALETIKDVVQDKSLIEEELNISQKNIKQRAEKIIEQFK